MFLDLIKDRCPQHTAPEYCTEVIFINEGKENKVINKNWKISNKTVVIYT